MFLLRLSSVLCLTPLVGCLAVVEGPGEFNADWVVSEPCDAVRVQLDAGSVDVVRADVSDIQIQWGSTGVADAPQVEAAFDAEGVLVLEGRCSDGLSCGIDVAMLVPSGVTLDVQTGRGDVVLSGTNDGAQVWTGEGDIVLICVSGELDVETGSGDIDGSCLRSERVQAHSGHGDVVLGWTGPVVDARVTTGGGDVSLGVPMGAYEVDLTTGDGDILLAGVTPREGEDARLTVETAAGDVLISGI